jgi:superfamily II DNA helicase RecQ
MSHTPLRNVDPECLPLALTNLLGFASLDGQIKAIHSLVVDQVNLFLIAPTEWGKSAVFQAVSVLRGGICLTIMPLNLLEEDQVSRRRGA